MLDNDGDNELVGLKATKRTLRLLAEFVAAQVAVSRRNCMRIVKLESLLDDRLREYQNQGEKAVTVLASLSALLRSAGVVLPTGNCSNEPILLPNPVARSLVLRHNPVGGDWDVSIDYGKPFVAPNRVGRFLEFISSGSPAKSGDLVSFRPESELLEYIKGYKPDATRRDITILVYKLRAALDKANYPPELVQRNATDGVRFAWRPAGGAPHAL